MREPHAEARRGRLIEYSGNAPDPIRALAAPVPVGPVDRNGLGFVVSSLPRTDIAGNLLWWPIVLARAAVGRGSRAWLRGIRQYASIAALIPTGKDGATYVWEVPIERPAWSFQDGFLRWHLSVQYGEQLVPGGDPRVLDPYPGLGTFYDLRFDWTHSGRDQEYDDRIDGAAVVVLWVEVLQPPQPPAPLLFQGPTGPTLVAPLIPVPVGGVTVDPTSPDAFVQAILQQQDRSITIGWHRLAGAIVLEHELPEVDV